MENGHRNHRHSGFSHEKWVDLSSSQNVAVHQRVEIPGVRLEYFREVDGYHEDPWLDRDSKCR